MKKYIPYIIIAILIGVILLTNIGVKPEVETITKSDTVTIMKIDTFLDSQPHYLTKRVVDTIYIHTNSDSILELPITQQYYHEKDKYEAWVSGYSQNLDSIRTFNKTEYQTITNTITQKIYPKRWDLYLDVNGTMVGRELMPSIGMSIAMPNKLKIGANVGYYDKNMVYGVTLGWKLTK